MGRRVELAERIREVIDGRPGVVERKMLGGIAWMVTATWPAESSARI